MLHFDKMFQANTSYEWFLLHIVDNTKWFYEFVHKLETTNMVFLPCPPRPRQTKGLPE